MAKGNIFIFRGIALFHIKHNEERNTKESTDIAIGPENASMVGNANQLTTAPMQNSMAMKMDVG